MSCYVYFIKPVDMDGPIKIGSSYSPDVRKIVVEAWSPFPLEVLVTIPGDAKLERRIHNCFAHAHTHGEWFALDPDLRRLIAALRAGVSIHDAINLDAPTGNVLGMKQRAAMLRNGTTNRPRERVPA